MDNNVFESQIFQAIKDIRQENRRPDVNAIYKNITRANATNITVEDVQQQVDLLIASANLKNTPTSQGLDSFYIIGNITTVQVDLTIECLQEDSMESIDVRITEQLSSQNLSPTVTDTNRQVKRRYDNFNAQMVAIKANFMNETYELKNEVNRLRLRIKYQDSDIQIKQNCLCWNMKSHF